MRQKIGFANICFAAGVCFLFASCGGRSSQASESAAQTYTVTFKQEGREDIFRSVRKGETLADIPSPFSEAGYTTVWDVDDFSSIEGNLIVTAVRTANTYTILYDLGINTSATLKSASALVTYGEEFTLETPVYNGFATFYGWYLADENGDFTDTKVENGKYLRTENITVIAKWKEWSDVVN